MRELSYKKAGVDIDKANLFIEKIKPLIKTTKRKGWVNNIGAFSGFFKADLRKYKDPLIVSSTDGVGTKLLIAILAGKHDTVGIDLVAMSVNDIITCGAEPLFFLDYYATGKLSLKVSCEIMKGIVKGCRLANLSLVGGETAELPGLYKAGDYDLAGFAVGIVEKNKVIDGRKTKKGDLILGLASSGLHSNGYSLARRVLLKGGLSNALSKELLTPTTIYVRPVLDIVRRFNVKGIANITGGGFYDNIIRILPGNARAVIYRGLWKIPPIFNLIKEKGSISDKEMFRTLNMGVGMILTIPRDEILKAKNHLLKRHNLKSWIIGEILTGKKRVDVI